MKTLSGIIVAVAILAAFAGAWQFAVGLAAGAVIANVALMDASK